MTRSRLRLIAACAALLLARTWMWAAADVELAGAGSEVEDVAVTATTRPVWRPRRLLPNCRRPVRGRRLARERLEAAATEARDAGSGDRASAAATTPEKRVGGIRRCFSKADYRSYQVQHAGIPQASRDAARELAVGDAALEAAFAAYVEELRWEHGDKLLTQFAEHGSEGFRAVVALLRGGLHEAAADDLLARTFVPGEERNLLDVVAAAEGTGRHAALLARLGSVDAPAVRNHLLRRLDLERDPARFAACATSLGRLREPRALTACAVALRNHTWGGAHRRPICAAMIAIDERRASELFVDHLRRPDTEFLDGVAGFLAKIDPALAAREADMLLHGRLGTDRLFRDGSGGGGGGQSFRAAVADRRAFLVKIAGWKPPPET